MFYGYRLIALFHTRVTLIHTRVNCLLQEDFNKLRVLSYINSDVFLVCFSVNNPETLDNAEECWVPELRGYMPNTPFVLVGTQTDVRNTKPYFQDQVSCGKLLTTRNFRVR